MAGIFQATSEDLWRGSIYGSWGTVLVILFISICHLFFCSKINVRSILSRRLRTSPVVADCHISNISPSSPPQLRIMEAISDTDLKSLVDNLDGKLNENEKWERVVDKSNDLLSYSAKSCKPKDGPLKYSSVTIFENCCPKLLRDFYMDNDFRKQWDNTLLMHEQLQMDGTSGIEVGRTLKKFPLLTPREYVLSWRLWEGKDETCYCFTKECEHPLAPQQKKYVRVTFFRSGWRIRRVSGRNACEISMLHQEDAGLNVEMAKLAFSKGIWSFVCKMNKALRKYALINNPPSSSLITAVTLIKKAATRSCFYAGFAAQRNFAEVIAKGEAQGMVSKSIGMMLGITLANRIRSSTSLALGCFSIVTLIHMFCNLKSYKSIQLRTLNPYRASLVFSEYLLSGEVPSIKDVNNEEPLFPAVPFLNTKLACGEPKLGLLSTEAKESAANIEKRLQLGSKLSDVVSCEQDVLELLSLYTNENYILSEHRGRYCVMLKESASPVDMLKALFHVNYLHWLERNAGIIARSASNDCRPGGRLQMSLEYVRREFNHVKYDGELAGWLADGLIARPLTNRICQCHVAT